MQVVVAELGVEVVGWVMAVMAEGLEVKGLVGVGGLGEELEEDWGMGWDLEEGLVGEQGAAVGEVDMK